MQNNNTTQTILTKHCRPWPPAHRLTKLLLRTGLCVGWVKQRPLMWCRQGEACIAQQTGIVRCAAVFARHRNIASKSCPFPILLADLHIGACIHFQWSQGGGLCCDSMDMPRVANTWTGSSPKGKYPCEPQQNLFQESKKIIFRATNILGKKMTYDLNRGIAATEGKDSKNKSLMEWNIRLCTSYKILAS